MAEDVIKAGGPAAPMEPVVRPQAEPSRAERARHSAYRSRFVIVYFALATVLGGGIGALAVGLRSTGATTAETHANVLTPATSGEIAAITLAQNVKRLYRLADGTALADIVATRNTLQNGNLGFLRVRFQIIQPLDAANTNRDSQVLPLGPTDAIQYSLCGNAAGCAIPGNLTAAETLADAALLQREALELALRTLQHDATVNNVSVFIRPVPVPKDSSFEGYVDVFDRNVITKNDPALLSQPLQDTLPGVGSRMTPAQMGPDEIVRIDELTRPYLYVYRYQIVGGRDAVIDLQPAANS